MDYDEFVSQPQMIDDRISHQLQVVERWKSKVESVTAVLSEVRVQTSPENKREIWLAKYIDSQQKLTVLMEDYDRACDEVRTWLYDNLPPNEASLLEYRYCDGLRNPEIAEVERQAEQTIRNKISVCIRKARVIYNANSKTLKNSK